MGSALLVGNFAVRNTKQLEVSCTQALVLLAFNEKEEYKYNELLQKTGFTEVELNKQLISMACLQHKILSIVQPVTASTENKEEEAKNVDKTTDAVKIQDPKQQTGQTVQSTNRPKMIIKKTISKEDSFKVNDKFRSQLKRITINSI